MTQQHTRATAGQDTVAAIATPPGTSGIAVIRVSGDDAINRVAGRFSGADIREAQSHTLHHGLIRDADHHVLDEVLVSVFHEPSSYTGENSVEISCHGGAVVSRRVLSSLLETGIRHADPGEFTRRAFLNGKMDLAQAEAVADLIHAQSEEAHKASMQQLEGTLSRFVSGIRDELLRAAGMLELSLDFVEDDVDLLDDEQLATLFDESISRINAALDSYGSGRIIRDGMRVALAGPPNVGKSSLLNALLGTRRAIVTETPGTTRDYIEEGMLLNGEYMRFIDTAGMRQTDDRIEAEGIAFSRSVLHEADIVCLMADARDGASEALTVRDLALIEEEDARVLLLFNKVDLVPADAAADLAEHGVVISARTGEGMDRLTARLVELARAAVHTPEQGSVLVTNARHADCLRRGIDALEDARRARRDGMTEEFLAYEVRRAIDALGEIIGAVTSEEVLNGIFARFCIGK